MIMTQVPRIAVGVLVYNEKNEIFLAQSHKWGEKWIVPGGHIDWGERIHDCVIREVKEETGMDIEQVQMLQLQESIFPEEFHDKRHFIFLDFMAAYKEGDIILNEELQKYKWVTASEAMKMNLNESTKSFIHAFMHATDDSHQCGD